MVAMVVGRTYPAGRFVIEPGDVVEFVCRGCFKDSTWLCTEPNQTPASYCTKSCQKSASKRRNNREHMRLPCPRPNKVSYQTVEAAQAAQVRCVRRFGAQEAPRLYLCKCGMYHLGRVNYVKVEGSGGDD